MIMKNIIFLSPNFPENYWKFCKELKNNGLNVLGIGDCPYDNLLPELKDSLNEYYKVSSLENYDEVFRAVAFFAHKDFDKRFGMNFHKRLLDIKVKASCNFYKKTATVYN